MPSNALETSEPGLNIEKESKLGSVLSDPQLKEFINKDTSDRARHDMELRLKGILPDTFLDDSAHDAAMENGNKHSSIAPKEEITKPQGSSEPNTPSEHNKPENRFPSKGNPFVLKLLEDLRLKS